MKKSVVLLGLILVLVLSACGSGNNSAGNNSGESDGDTTKIKVGASSVPHAEILEEAKPILKEKGIDLEIEEFQDYITPNDALADGDLDANFFQHIPFLKQTIEDTGYDFDHFEGIHIEPMGAYSKDYDTIDDIPDGTEVLVTNAVADHPRVLALFEKAGLIELDDSVKESNLTFDDITSNPKDLTFSPDYDAAFLPELYQKEDDVLVVINTNYAIEAGLEPQEDALFVEDDESRYVNVVAAQSEDMDNEALQTLVDVLHSDEIQTFIKDEYDGAVVPVNGNS